MRRLFCALLALTALAATARAQTVIQAPFVTVQTGNGVYVRAPFVNLAIPAQRRVVPMTVAPASTATLPAPDLVPTVDVPPGVTAPKVVLPSTDLTPVKPAPMGPAGPTGPTVVRPWTLPEFARDFHAAPGRYEVVFIHPVTCCPVKVCFCLPDGCVKTVRLHDQRVTFHYGLAKNVILQFNSNGSVSVHD